MFKFEKIKAFTLSEMLLAMAILGIVAGIALSATVSNYQAQKRINALKIAYENINYAAKTAVAKYTTVTDISTIVKNLALSADCGSVAANTTNTCWSGFPNSVVLTGGRNLSTATTTYREALLKNGISLAIANYESGLYTSSGVYPTGLFVCFVNVDGPISSPIYGENVFAFTISTSDASRAAYTEMPTVTPFSPIPFGFTGIYSSDMAGDLLVSEISPIQLTRWALVNGNMDYLKVDSENKCPDGNVLTWTAKTSCK